MRARGPGYLRESRMPCRTASRITQYKISSPIAAGTSAISKCSGAKITPMAIPVNTLAGNPCLLTFPHKPTAPQQARRRRRTRAADCATMKE